jgi:signal transduction histidine kinase
MPLIQKMLLTILSIALVPAFLVGSIFFTSSRASLRDRESDQLTAIATLQENRIDELMARNTELLTGFENRQTPRTTLERYGRTHVAADKAALQQIVTDTRTGTKSFREVTMLDPNGIVVASTREDTVGTSCADKAYFATAKLRNDISDFFFREPNGEPGLYLVGPLMLNGALVGEVVIEWDTNNLLAATNDYTGLGDTGEINLVRHTADGGGEYLTPARFDNDSALKLKIAKTATTTAAFHALSGKEGTATGMIDYRGHVVLASTRYLPEFGWGLVVKVDEDEAFEPLAQLGNLLVVVMFILSVVIIFLAFYLARLLNGPILTLAAAADAIRAGDLSARANVSTHDEIGQLAGTFNAMASNYEKVDQMKSEFVLLTSHQLRTPATAVKGFISMLLDGYAGKVAPKQRDLIAAAYTENERQISVINSILDVAKLEAGEMALVRRMCDLIPLIEASAAGQQPLLESKSQKLVFHKPKNPVELWVDGEKLQLVFDNFIHNAIKYSPPDTTITIELKSRPQQAIIDIKDQGIGIAHKDLHRLFKRFSRISSPQTSNIQGAGLGLYLADKLVAMHGGKINVQSQEGKGTTFSIELPNVSKKEPQS